MSDEAIRFLSVEDVLILHRIAIEDQGGDPTLCDHGLLESALAMPKHKFGGEYAHPGISDMAAAYAFHICKNHPFIDGNKRAAFAAMVAFLTENGWSFDADVDEAERTILGLAAGRVDKEALTAWLKVNSHEKPSMELRDFFKQLSARAFVDDVVSVEAQIGKTPTARNEAVTTNIEASNSMPAIQKLAQWAVEYHSECMEAERQGRREEAEKARKIFRSLDDFRSTLVAIYRIAEDMGYEW